MWIRFAPFLILASPCLAQAALHDFVAPEEAVMDHGLLGVWASGSMALLFQANGNDYTVRWIEGSKSIVLSARMVRVGGATLLDVAGTSQSPFLLKVHFLVRIWLEAATLTVGFLDWSGEEFPTVAIDHDRLLTGDGPAWRQAVQKTAAGKPASSWREIFTKVR